MAACETRVTAAPIQPAALLDGLAGRDPDCGGIASFVGQVRAGDGLTALEIEHFPGVTDVALNRLADRACEQWPLSRVVIVHRTGRMAVGDPIVFVGAAAPHRRAALEAVEYMIDVLKTQAPFWKKAYTANGEHWIEPRAEDHDAARQWLEKEE